MIDKRVFSYSAVMDRQLTDSTVKLQSLPPRGTYAQLYLYSYSRYIYQSYPNFVWSVKREDERSNLECVLELSGLTNFNLFNREIWLFFLLIPSCKAPFLCRTSTTVASNPPYTIDQIDPRNTTHKCVLFTHLFVIYMSIDALEVSV